MDSMAMTKEEAEIRIKISKLTRTPKEGSTEEDMKVYDLNMWAWREYVIGYNREYTWDTSE